MFRLGYYRLVPEINPVAAMDEPEVDCNYTPYHIFVLKTRLFPLLYDLYPNVSPTFESRYENGRMEAYLILSQETLSVDDFTINPALDVSQKNRDIITKKIQEIQNISPEYSLISVKELYRTTDHSIPESYFREMIGYTQLEEVQLKNPYNVPVCKPSGSTDLSVFDSYLTPDGIMLSFNPNSDYKKAYGELNKFIVNKIQEFHKKGTVVLANMSNVTSKDVLIQNWQLQRIDLDSPVGTLYQADWTDQRFAKDITAFLLSRVHGQDWIELWVGANMVDRHAAAAALIDMGLKLVDFETSGDYIKILCNNLSQAQLYSSRIEMAISKAYGQVLPIASHRLGDVLLYQKQGQKLYPNQSNIIYRDRNDYMFSIMLPEKVKLEELRQEFRDTAVTQLINVSKISKFKSSSPHNIIEQEYGIDL